MLESLPLKKDELKQQGETSDFNSHQNQINTRPQPITLDPKLLFAVLLLIIFLGIIYFLVGPYNSLENKINLKPLLVTTTPTLLNPTSAPTPTIVCPPITPIPEQVYLLEIRKKPNTKDPGDLGFIITYLEELLGFPDRRCLKRNETSYLTGALYDTRDKANQGKYDRNLYVILRASIDEDKTHENDFFTLKASKADQKLKPYIGRGDSLSYCEIDSDCRISKGFCDDGTNAVNYYMPYLPIYGCEPPGGNGYDQKSKCSYDVEYQNPRCQNNKCVGDIKTFKCISCEGDWMNEKGTCATVTPTFQNY